MNVALLLARLLLAGVFVVAGVAKLTDRAGSRRTLAAFGVPGALTAPLAIILPVAELGIAIGLVRVSAAWWAALGALTLLLLFSGAIVLNLARGRRPECRCFGQLRPSRVGTPTVIRNVSLAVVAGFILWPAESNPGPSAVGWFIETSTAERLAILGAIVVAGVLAVQGWIVLNLLRQNGRLLGRLEALEKHFGIDPTAPAGLPVGTPAPAFEVGDIHGETQALDRLRASGKPLLLVFIDPDCGPCKVLLPQLPRWEHEHAAEFTLVVVSRGTAETNLPLVAEHRVTRILLQRDDEVAAAYHADARPSAVIVRTDGTIGSPVASGEDEIHQLLMNGRTRPPHAPLPR